jgi:anti-anti-sigma regulatory factor
MASVGILEMTSMTQSVIYQLPGDCSIAHVSHLQRELNNLLDTCMEVIFHADSVSKIDAAGVQLLFGFVSALNAKGGHWQWVEPSQRLRTAVQLLGMGDRLHIH